MEDDSLDALPPGLYIVAGPIGNLRDITLRALDYLRAVDVIACEDTRHTQRLLQRYEIVKPLVSLHAHNEAMRTHELMTRVTQEGLRVAYLTDAGSPAVSDPGERLVHHFRSAGLHCDVLPGPSAVITAVTGAGLGSTPFIFEGFLPTKKGQRLAALRHALENPRTTVFYESPHRIRSTLAMLLEIAPDRLICVARELTKRHQEYLRGPVSQIHAHFESREPRGEFCLVIAPATLPRWLRLEGNAG